MGKREVSSPVYKVRLEKNVLITLSDGTDLVSDIYRPDHERPFPMIAYMGPYHKDLIVTGGSIAGLPEYFAKRGYTFAVIDARGTGGSEGHAPHMFSVKEQEDGFDAVEWLASQPWCDGSVGMFGSSYGFFTSLLTAARNPPHLKAIGVLYGGTDFYQSIFRGGNFVSFLFGGFYDPMMIATNALPQAYRDPAGRWAKVWRNRLHGLVPWVFSWLDHQTDGPFWHQSSICKMYDKIRVPVFAIGGWKDLYPSMPFQLFTDLKAPKKILIGPWTHSRPDTGIPLPQVDHVNETLRWFDYWLKGMDNGVMKEPPITLYVQEYTTPEMRSKIQKGRWRFEKGFPVKRRQETVLFFGGNGLLQFRPNESAGGYEEFRYDPSVGLTAGLFGGLFGDAFPLDQRPDEALSPTWRTPPLHQDTEVTGFGTAIIYVSSSADIATFVAKLSDVAPDGKSSLVTRGSMNATRRESWESPRPLIPGEVYELKIQLDATSYIFEKGHRIRIALYGSDFPFIWPTPKRCQNKIYHSTQYPSRLLLPRILGGGSVREKPRLRKPPDPPLFKIHPPETPSWKVSTDLVANRVEVEWGTASGKVVSTVSPDKPEEASVLGISQITSKRGTGSVDVQGKTLIESDSQAFHVSCSLKISVDGVPTFVKDWTNSFPRIFM